MPLERRATPIEIAAARAAVQARRPAAQIRSDRAHAWDAEDGSVVIHIGAAERPEPPPGAIDIVGYVVRLRHGVAITVAAYRDRVGEDGHRDTMPPEPL